MAAKGDDTTALWHQYRRTKDQAIRDRLILTYAPLVKYVAGRLGSGLPAHVDDDELNESLTEISRSSIAALDELWTISSSGGDQIALIDTIEDESGPDPQAALSETELKEAIGEAIARLSVLVLADDAVVVGRLADDLPADRAQVDAPDLAVRRRVGRGIRVA